MDAFSMMFLEHSLSGPIFSEMKFLSQTLFFDRRQVAKHLLEQIVPLVPKCVTVSCHLSDVSRLLLTPPNHNLHHPPPPFPRETSPTNYIYLPSGMAGPNLSVPFAEIVYPLSKVTHVDNISNDISDNLNYHQHKHLHLLDDIALLLVTESKSDVTAVSLKRTSTGVNVYYA